MSGVIVTLLLLLRWWLKKRYRRLLHFHHILIMCSEVLLAIFQTNSRSDQTHRKAGKHIVARVISQYDVSQLIAKFCVLATMVLVIIPPIRVLVIYR